MTLIEYAVIGVLSANLLVFGAGLLQALLTGIRLETEGFGPRRILRGPLQAVPAVWRGLLRLITYVTAVSALAAAMGVGAWLVLFAL